MRILIHILCSYLLILTWFVKLCIFIRKKVKIFNSNYEFKLNLSSQIQILRRFQHLEWLTVCLFLIF